MMDALLSWPAWLSTATPVLPSTSTLRWALPLFWAVVFAFLALRLAARVWPAKQRPALVVAALAAAWAFVPGMGSPTWWLGLAFQLPSWTTVLCGLWGLVAFGRAQPQVQEPVRTPGVLVWLAVVAGLLLLLDMFVLLPFPLYRWGFSAFAVAVLLAVVALSWVGARSELRRRQAAIAFAALALFVLTRLPTGNVFDAMLDPWLWLVLCVGGARQLLGALKVSVSKRRSTRG